ncbi:MAG: toxin-antitoxin system HicB family antitoxin [Candidatus Contendobacter sp.]
MMDPFRYHIMVSKVCLDGTEYFEASVKELPDVREYGDTYQEAFDLAIDTISTAAAMYAEEGRAFPEPTELVEDYSGRVTLRMPKTLHRTLAEQAEAEDISLNQYVLSLLAQGAGFRQGAKKAVSQPPAPVLIKRETGTSSASVDWLTTFDGNVLQWDDRPPQSAKPVTLKPGRPPRLS